MRQVVSCSEMRRAGGNACPTKPPKQRWAGAGRALVGQAFPPTRIVPAILVLILTPGLIAQPQGGLQAGVAKVNLEPALGMEMSGYGARTGVAQGILDPVQGRVLAISDGRRTIALVTLDLAYGFDLPEMEEIRAAVRPSVEQVI